MANDGSFSWVIEWGLDKGEKDGWIVQEVSMKYFVRHCVSDKVVFLDRTLTYYEAWEVKASKIYANFPTQGGTDTFGSPGTTRRYCRGEITFRGQAFFYKGSLPSDFKTNGVSEAHGLRSTKKKPGFWPNAHLLIHEIRVKWQRCPCNKPPFSSSVTIIPTKP